MMTMMMKSTKSQFRWLHPVDPRLLAMRREGCRGITLSCSTCEDLTKQLANEKKFVGVPRFVSSDHEKTWWYKDSRNGGLAPIDGNWYRRRYFTLGSDRSVVHAD